MPPFSGQCPSFLVPSCILAVSRLWRWVTEHNVKTFCSARAADVIPVVLLVVLFLPLQAGLGSSQHMNSTELTCKLLCVNSFIGICVYKTHWAPTDFDFWFRCYIYIVCLLISYASPLILFSSLCPYFSHLLTFSFENRPTPVPGRMS